MESTDKKINNLYINLFV